MGEAESMIMPKLALSLAAFLIGLALVLAWGFNVFGDWATDIIAGLLLTGGAWGMIDAYEDWKDNRE
jgi:hypothetical protein